MGIATLLSALYVRFRDVKPIWDVLLQVLLYGSPVIYAIETIETRQGAARSSCSTRSAAILQQMRHALIDPTRADRRGGGGRRGPAARAAGRSSSGS